MTTIPFASQLVLQRPPDAMPTGELITMPDGVREALQGDPSQSAAVEFALHHNVTLVQGPPGTGKSYVGVQIAKALINSGSHERILCLCYTNHALDDFLETLVDNGISLESIVRLGSGPKISPRLKARCLEELKQGGATRFDRSQSIRYSGLKRRMKELEGDVKEARCAMAEVVEVLGLNHWKKAGPFLEAEHPEVYGEFEVPRDATAAAAGMTQVDYPLNSPTPIPSPQCTSLSPPSLPPLFPLYPLPLRLVEYFLLMSPHSYTLKQHILSTLLSYYLCIAGLCGCRWESVERL